MKGRRARPLFFIVSTLNYSLLWGWGGGGGPRASVRRFLSGLQVEGRQARGGDEAEMRARALARFYAMIQTVFVLTA